MAFVVLGINVEREDLRRFIQLADSNRDGKVDFKEFHDVLMEDDAAIEDQLDQVCADS